MSGGNKAGNKPGYDAAERRRRYDRGPVMPGRTVRFDHAVSRACLELMMDRGTADITFTDLATVCPVSARTLRRHYPCVAAAAYPRTWWLLPPTHAVQRVLDRRPRLGPCWPTGNSALDPEVS